MWDRYERLNHQRYQEYWNSAIETAWLHGYQTDRALAWHLKYHELSFLNSIVRDKVTATVMAPDFAQALFGKIWKEYQHILLTSIQEKGELDIELLHRLHQLQENHGKG